MSTEESKDDREPKQLRKSIITRHLDAPGLDSLPMTMMKTLPEEKKIGHCIIFYLAELREPIKLWNRNSIILGRYDRHLSLQPTVDFSRNHGILLGVSRIHAEIIYEDGQYYVRDLQSSNGTWVNKKRLVQEEKVQLVNHDTLRLGHLMLQIGTSLK